MTKPKKHRSFGVNRIARFVADEIGNIEEIHKITITYGGQLWKKVSIHNDISIIITSLITNFNCIRRVEKYVPVLHCSCCNREILYLFLSN